MKVLGKCIWESISGCEIGVSCTYEPGLPGLAYYETHSPA
jgi:hypothetical protein